MNKDVIYIDVDDDITAIIGKIKESKEKIVALVPPKHVGVLQSAVNLRLLDRMAKAEKKNLVVVTNNQALIALAASARIPVAKNLQSKPEIADIPALAVDDGDDIIDGSELPVGDHARSTAKDDDKERPHRATALHTKPSRTDAVETLEIEDAVAPVAAVAATRVAKKTKGGPKIPNFNKFRARLFLIIAAGVLLIAGLVWAFAFAPAATVTITADTKPQQVSGTVKLGGTAATDYKTGVISSEAQTLKKDAVVTFTATGTQDTGDKATGNITVKNCDSNTAFGLAAGTVFTSASGKKFASNAAANVPGFTGSASACRNTGAGAGTVTIAVTAQASGESYNIAATSYTIAGVDGDVYANGTAMAGGTSKITKVVSDNDVQLAVAQITGQSNDAAKKAVIAQFKNGEVAIDGSFTAEQGTPVASPAVGQAVGADGKATLTVPMTYTVQGLTKSALDTYLNANLNSQLASSKNQRIYDNGAKKVSFSNFAKAEDGTMTVNLIATGSIGPQIDETAVKNSIKGMVTGSVQTTLGAIDGVQDVDVKYSYFWVNAVPNNTNKITIEFKLANG